MSETLSNELLVLRKRKKLTLKQVAKDNHTTVSRLSRYESNKVSITIKTLEELLNYYNEPFDKFFNNVLENMN